MKETRATVRLSVEDVETLTAAAKLTGVWNDRTGHRWSGDLMLSRFLRVAALHAAKLELEKSQTTVDRQMSDNAPAESLTSGSSGKSDKIAAAGKSDKRRARGKSDKRGSSRRKSWTTDRRGGGAR